MGLALWNLFALVDLCDFFCNELVALFANLDDVRVLDTPALEWSVRHVS
jgi:hypothetical protein